MYTYVLLYIYVHIYTYVHTHIYIFTYTNKECRLNHNTLDLNIHMYVVLQYIHKYICIHMHVYVYTSPHTHTDGERRLNDKKIKEAAVAQNRLLELKEVGMCLNIKTCI